MVMYTHTVNGSESFSVFMMPLLFPPFTFPQPSHHTLGNFQQVQSLCVALSANCRHPVSKAKARSRESLELVCFAFADNQYCSACYDDNIPFLAFHVDYPTHSLFTADVQKSNQSFAHKNLLEKKLWREKEEGKGREDARC